MQKHSSLVAAAMAIAAYSPGIQLASSSQSEDPYKPVIVAADADADAMNRLHGESYGVDWVYPAKQ